MENLHYKVGNNATTHEQRQK